MNRTQGRGGHGRWLGPLALTAVATLTGIALWQTREVRLVVVSLRPQGVMGTGSTLLGVLPAGREAEGLRALRRAEQRLRRVEALMSVHLEDSELAALNRARAGEAIPLSPETLTVLQAARELWEASQGAFDITCRPLLLLWHQAAAKGRQPAPGELEAAREASSWEHLELLPDGARKRLDTFQDDLGGIAKGYAIDQALEALQEAGLAGGLVEVGGDMRSFGTRPGGRAWVATLRAPSGTGTLGDLFLRGKALCTSGDYARPVAIAGELHSHIVDPRTGRAAHTVRSASVLAQTALLADGWATALSVLGPPGLNLLPAGVEALLITGDPDDLQTHATDGFPSTHPVH